MWNAGLDEAQTGIKIAGRNINNLRYADDSILMAERKEELKSVLMKVKKESEKAGLKLNIQKMKVMASGPITSWQVDGETMEIVTYFLFQNHCSPEIKRCLLLGRKAITNLDSILKSRGNTLLTKVHIVKATVCNSFSSKEQASFSFMAAVTVCSDFGTQENGVFYCFHFFPFCLPWRWDGMPWPSFFECWVLRQLFHSPLSPSSRGSLVDLHFLL